MFSKQGNNERENYSLTQSPLKETVTDLWRLMKDYNVSTIVMLNQISDDQVKKLLKSDIINIIVDPEKCCPCFCHNTFSQKKQKPTMKMEAISISTVIL